MNFIFSALVLLVLLISNTNGLEGSIVVDPTAKISGSTGDTGTMTITLTADSELDWEGLTGGQVWAYAYIQSDEPETYDLFDHSSGSAFIDCIFSIDGSDQVTTCQADAGDSPALYFPDDYGNFAAGSELKMTFDIKIPSPKFDKWTDLVFASSDSYDRLEIVVPTLFEFYEVTSTIGVSSVLNTPWDFAFTFKYDLPPINTVKLTFPEGTLLYATEQSVLCSLIFETSNNLNAATMCKVTGNVLEMTGVTAVGGDLKPDIEFRIEIDCIEDETVDGDILIQSINFDGRVIEQITYQQPDLDGLMECFFGPYVYYLFSEDDSYVLGTVVNLAKIYAFGLTPNSVFAHDNTKGVSSSGYFLPTEMLQSKLYSYEVEAYVEAALSAKVALVEEDGSGVFELFCDGSDSNTVKYIVHYADGSSTSKDSATLICPSDELFEIRVQLTDLTTVEVTLMEADGSSTLETLSESEDLAYLSITPNKIIVGDEDTNISIKAFEMFVYDADNVATFEEEASISAGSLTTASDEYCAVGDASLEITMSALGPTTETDNTGFFINPDDEAFLDAFPAASLVPFTATIEQSGISVDITCGKDALVTKSVSCVLPAGLLAGSTYTIVFADFVNPQSDQEFEIKLQSFSGDDKVIEHEIDITFGPCTTPSDDYEKCDTDCAAGFEEDPLDSDQCLQCSETLVDNSEFTSGCTIECVSDYEENGDLCCESPGTGEEYEDDASCDLLCSTGYESTGGNCVIPGTTTSSTTITTSSSTTEEETLANYALNLKTSFSFLIFIFTAFLF